MHGIRGLRSQCVIFATVKCHHFSRAQISVAHHGINVSRWTNLPKGLHSGWGATVSVLQWEMLNRRLWQQKHYFRKALAPSTALTPLFVSKSSELLFMEADAFPRTLVAFCVIRVVSENFITQRMTGINFGCQKAMYWVSTRLAPKAAQRTACVYNSGRRE